MSSHIYHHTILICPINDITSSSGPNSTRHQKQNTEESKMSTGAGWQQAAVTPQLEVISCGSFSATPIWDDRGTGARGDGIAFWRVVPPPGTPQTNK